MNGLNTKVDVNIIVPLCSYDYVIGMYYLEKQHVVLEYYNKTITCIYEEGQEGKVEGIPRVAVVREIYAIHLKKIFRKGFHIFVAHVDEAAKDRVEIIEEPPVLRDFEDVFREIPVLPPKRDIDLSIDLVPGASLVSKTPFIMDTLEFKYLQMELE
jgi:hypothetical protein